MMTHMAYIDNVVLRYNNIFKQAFPSYLLFQKQGLWPDVLVFSTTFPGDPAASPASFILIKLWQISVLNF